MKKTLLFALIATTALGLNAQKTVNVATPGTLGTLLTAEEQKTLTQLTITGQLNSADVKVLRAMTKTKADRFKPGLVGFGVLEDLDLSGAQFVKDNTPYYSDNDNMEDYGTKPGSISGYMFYSSMSLKHFVAPAGTKAIESGAFQDAEYLETFTGADIQVFGAGCFSGCKVLEPVSLEYARSIGASAFSKNLKITTVDIPDDLTEDTFSTNAFSGCDNIEMVKIGNGVTKFSTYSFNNLPKLKTVDLGNNVQEVNGNSFNDLKSLETFIIRTPMVPSRPNLQYATGPFVNVPSTATLYVPDQSVQMYSVALYWKNFSNVKTISEMLVGIDDVEMEANGPVRYFNLQGIEVAEPTSGLYIRMQGEKATKVVIRK